MNALLFLVNMNTRKKSKLLTSEWAVLNRQAFDSTVPLYGHEQYYSESFRGAYIKTSVSRQRRILAKLDFDGYSIGGLAVGEPVELMYELVDFTTDLISEEKPRYLMGVGRPENILEAIARGVDMFDCVMPTRNARNAYLFTSAGIVSMRNAAYKDDFSTPRRQLRLLYLQEFFTVLSSPLVQC